MPTDHGKCFSMPAEFRAHHEAPIGTKTPNKRAAK